MRIDPTSPPRVLVVGCGGIGGVLLATLVEQGRKVSCVAHREEIAAALRSGPTLRDENGVRKVTGELEVFVQVPAAGAFEFIVLATPPNRVEDAARSVRHLLAPGGALVCIQNGLCEERVAEIVGRENVIGAVVAWGASAPEPAVYERTSSGGFMLGRLDGTIDDRLRALATVLEAVGPVELTTNLRGARWSKLALNCAVSSLGTVGGQRLGGLMMHRFVRRLALEAMSEVVEVARAEGVKLEKVAGTIDLDWIALTENERRVPASASLLAKHSLLLAVGARYRRLRSSMLAAIERGREPPVDFLNGEVVRFGAQHHVSTPVNALLTQTVHAIANKQRATGLDTLRSIFHDTRARA